MNILFVCTGNVSRSFLAEMLLKYEIKRHKLENVAVSSAGLYAYQGMPADPEIIDYLSKTGVPWEKHKARTVTKEDVDLADLILVMEKGHLEALVSQWPQAKDKIGLLSKYIAPDQAEDDIIDPYGKSLYHYRVTQAQITMAVRSLIREILFQDKEAG
jgi:protein-tyrosine phosphatase